ncbi:DNA-binding response regulator [Massilia phosphatilytica]|nr:DNA-binding response regulator [Massilia phosphatilytica]
MFPKFKHQIGEHMSDAAQLTILVLEDQGLVRAGMRELIRIAQPDAHIEEAATYGDAITLLSTNRFDLAFLDFTLKSEKTGLDVVKYLREHNLDTRAIMLSAHADRELVLECIQAGACGYIPKDMDHDGIFRHALDTVFQGGIFVPVTAMARTGVHAPPVPPLPRIPATALGVTGRCLEVLYYLCQGLPNKTIASKMQVEEGTIRKDYVPKLFRIFQVTRRTELLVEVSRRGIIVPPLPR